MAEKRSVLDVLSDEELAKVPALTKSEIVALLEKGREIRLEAEARRGSPVLPQILFR